MRQLLARLTTAAREWLFGKPSALCHGSAASSSSQTRARAFDEEQGRVGGQQAPCWALLQAHTSEGEVQGRVFVWCSCPQQVP